MSKASACPRCGTRSERIHSRYLRRVTDLPLAGRSVQLVVVGRRFRCSAVCVANASSPSALLTGGLGEQSSWLPASASQYPIAPVDIPLGMSILLLSRTVNSGALRLLTFPIRTAVLFHTEGLEPSTVTAPRPIVKASAAIVVGCSHSSAISGSCSTGSSRSLLICG